MPAIYYTSIFLIEPINLLKLVNLSFDGDVKKTFKMIRAFLKTAIKKIMLRNTGSVKRTLKNKSIKFNKSSKENLLTAA